MLVLNKLSACLIRLSIPYAIGSFCGYKFIQNYEASSNGSNANIPSKYCSTSSHDINLSQKNQWIFQNQPKNQHSKY